MEQPGRNWVRSYARSGFLVFIRCFLYGLVDVYLVQGFASNLAYRHYHRTLQRKVWDAWHSVVEARWRQRVEKACQAKAQEVCITLTNDYETKLASVSRDVRLVLIFS